MPGVLMTRWAADVSPGNVHADYPRPMMTRPRWQSLNGLWEYAISNETQPSPAPPAAFEGRILVPFPIESALSGVGRLLEPEQTLWYRRTFTVPADWSGQNVLLHFGAVDWECEVRLNGRAIATHKGGFDPFSVDITSHLRTGQDNELIVVVRDPTDSAGQPRGKQVRAPNGIWYTRASGIWQTVWIEPVPRVHIQSCRVRPDVGGRRVVIETKSSSSRPPLVTAEVKSNGQSLVREIGRPGEPIALTIPNMRLWTPDDPFLYDVEITLIADDGSKDIVQSYVGMRDVRVGPDKAGVNRILLNGQPVFQFGPLDQGYWPDGLLTPPTDQAMKADIEMVKKMGGNMLRKHVKVESQRFYHWCDKLGVLVWQDMPSGDNPVEPAASRQQFEAELKSVIAALINHPSIIMWVPFNEGWGQYDTQRIVELVMREDPRRLVNNASGWTDMNVGDVIDIHAYPGPAMAPAERRRASVLGEFGGLGLPIAGHTWVNKDNWGYVSFASKEELTEAYVALIEKLHPLIAQGLSAAVYTQLTDVEIEVNGWLTYDREVLKVDEARAAAAARRLFEPHDSLRTVVPASLLEPQSWRFTTAKPADDWMSPGFDDTKWTAGPGGFGVAGTPGAKIGTEWNTPDIWIRRTFDLAEADLADLSLLIHHDEDAEVFINGQPAASLSGYTVGYVIAPIDAAALKSLVAGSNTLAIHCRQTRGGQFIDCGLVQIVPPQR